MTWLAKLLEKSVNLLEIDSATARSRLAKPVAKKLSSQEKFKVAIGKILLKEYNESVGKAQLTKIVDQWEKEESCDVIKNAIEEILLTAAIPKWAEWISRRYTYVPGYFWLEKSNIKYGDTVLGWLDQNQVQAEPMPLKAWYQWLPEERYWEVLDWWEESTGFAVAEDLPLYWHTSVVTVPTEKLRSFCEHGFASPCAIQWERRCNQYDPLENGLYVTRTIVPHGFWKAWKWWPEAWIWYYEHRPELFEEEDVWGKRVRCEPFNPYAAVFSPSNSESLRARLFHIDDA